MPFARTRRQGHGRCTGTQLPLGEMIRFGRVYRSVALALLLATACAPNRAATTRESGPAHRRVAAAPPQAPISLTLRPYIGRLVTTTVTLGADTLRLLFDTGGGETVLTPSVAKRAACRPSPRTSGFRMNGERVVFEHSRDV